MTIPLDYMNRFARWIEPPPWNEAWAQSLGAACEVICERDATIEALQQQVKLLHDATIVLRNGMGGHRHFDFTMQHGAGCEVCIEQNKARDEADRLIALAMRPCNPMHPGDPSMCFGDETTCKCLRDE